MNTVWMHMLNLNYLITDKYKCELKKEGALGGALLYKITSIKMTSSTHLKIKLSTAYETIYYYKYQKNFLDFGMWDF